MLVNALGEVAVLRVFEDASCPVQVSASTSSSAFSHIPRLNALSVSYSLRVHSKRPKLSSFSFALIKIICCLSGVELSHESTCHLKR